MKAGRMNRRITIQEEATWTTNSLGERVPVWSDLETVWSEKRDLSMNELFKAGQVYAEITTAFRIRYRADVTPDKRISYGGQYYNIRSIIDVNDKQRELNILCTVQAT